MEKKSQGSYAVDTDSAIDQVAIDYKLKLIAFQDEIFRARKKLQDSDRRIAAIVESMDTYLQNKENQLAEVMLTARMNAQRIESQARTQVESFLLDISEEIATKQKDLRQFEKQAGEKGIALNELANTKINRDSDRLKVVKEVSPEPVASISETKPIEVETTVAPSEEKLDTGKLPDKLASHLEATKDSREVVLESLPVEPLVTEPSVKDNVVDIETKVAEKIAVDKETATKKRVVAKKATKSRAERNKSLLSGKTENVEETEAGLSPDIVLETEVKPEVETIVGIESDIIAEIQAEEVPIAEVVQEEVQTEAITEPHAEELPSAEEVVPKTIEFQPPPPVAPNETMRMDAFLDVRYYDNRSDDKRIEHHALQVTVDVEVPEDNYAVRYTKVNSDIVSALLRYDNVVLNDIYPFDFIDPNPQSIATYFFNYLEDTLSLMDLRLQAVTILEIPDLTIQVSSRNSVLDNMLHKDKDEFENLRASMKPCVEPEKSEGTDIKKRLNKIFGKR